MSERGSALVLALVVLVVLTSMGIALLMLCQYEGRMAHSDSRTKAVFYIAEAGLEHARKTLLDADTASSSPGSTDDELVTAAGGNGQLDFDPDTIRPVYDADGRVIAFTGYLDDVPIQAFTSFGEAKYIAFLTNDGIDEALDPLDDTNNRVVLTAIGAGPGFTTETVQALVVRSTLPGLPATITMLGPKPKFSGGKDKKKLLTGNDCDGAGIPGLYVPVVGVIGKAAETEAEKGVKQPKTFVSGPNTGVDTVTDIDATINPLWKDCSYLLDLADDTKASADVVGDSSTPSNALGTPGNPKTVYIDGNYTLKNKVDGAGLLWVTGKLTIQSGATWEGAIYAVGKGDVQRQGGSKSVLSGGFVVANVAGKDKKLGTADDCLGKDGKPGTGDDGFDKATFKNKGSGKGKTIYCSQHTTQTQGPFKVDQFRQR